MNPSLSLSVSLFLWLSPTRRVIIVVLRHYVRFSSRDQTCRLEQSCVGKIFEKRNNFSRYNAPVPLIRGNIGRRNLITRERERGRRIFRDINQLSTRVLELCGGSGIKENRGTILLIITSINVNSSASFR